MKKTLAYNQAVTEPNSTIYLTNRFDFSFFFVFKIFKK